MEPMPEAIPKPMPEEPRITDSALRNVKFGKRKVYTRRQKAKPEPTVVQESNSETLDEVNTINSSLKDETELNMDKDDQCNIPNFC